MAIKFSDLYGGGGGIPDEQPTSQPASSVNNTALVSAVPASHHASMAWLGFVIAAVALRVVYEISEE